MNTPLNIHIQPCTNDVYFEQVLQGIQQMQLDARNLNPNEFVIALLNHQILVGFGRLREYPSSCEISSVGVFEPYRNKGIGKKIIHTLIENKSASVPSEKNLYVVTILPDYFAKIGFRITKNFPSEIAEKWHYCTSQLKVPTPYVVMKWGTI